MSEQNSYDKKNFILGLVSGIAIISVIGFIVLLANGFGGEKNKKTTTDVGQIVQKPDSGKITINDSDQIRGDKNATITLVEYSDFQCPFCKNFQPTMLRVMDEYKSKARWVYRHFPLSFHQNAQKSAEASECAGEQGKFWEYSDKLFENSQGDGTGLNTEDLKKYAKELGLDAIKFNSCLDNSKYAEKVKNDMASGQAVGIDGTPTTILIDSDGNSQLIYGALPYEQIKAKIDAVLQ